MKIYSIVILFSLFIHSLSGQQKYDVFIFLHDECLISQYYTLTLNDLHKEYASKNIRFVGIFPNKISSKEDITSFRNKYNLKFDLIKDVDFLLTNKLGATVTPEVFVMEVDSEEIIYKGRIDNSYFRVGKRRTITSSSELEDVLVALKNDEEVLVENTSSVGCIIQMK